MSMRTRLQIWAMAALLAIFGSMAHAQVLYGTLTGNVTDPSGAAVPGAKVEALNVGTGVSREAATDERGVYLFTNIGSGQYKITVTAKAFKTTVEENVLVNTSEVRRVDFSLQITTTSETMEVSASAAVLQTDKADIHSEITPQEVTDLPYNGTEGKNPQALLLLLPGAVTTAGTGEANSQAGNPQRAITVSMNGASSQANATRIDGTMDSYPWLPVNVAYVPPPEAIETVSVSSNAFDAEQGAAGSAAINVTIKSGTNNLHGVLFERNTNQDFDAVNNYFSHPGRLAKNIINQFGFAVGGPVWIPKVIHGKNKLFWFMDYEGTRNNQYASDPNLTLPTAAMRTGDFSAAPLTIYDPLTGNANGTGRTPFPGNVIPTNRIASASATLTSLLPALTRPNQYTLNYDAYGGTTYSVDRWDCKTTYNPNPKDHDLGPLQRFSHGHLRAAGSGEGRRRCL